MKPNFQRFTAMTAGTILFSGLVHAAEGFEPKSIYECRGSSGSFIPVNRSTGIQYGDPQKRGWKTAEACTRVAVENATPESICSWNGTGTLYSVNGQAIQDKFTTVKDCLSFQRLIVKKFTAPAAQIQDYIQNPKNVNHSIFNSSRRAEGIKVGFKNWKQCQVPQLSNHPGKNKDGYLVSECSPDTLYSWGDYKTLEDYTKAMGDGKWVGKLHETLYTALSPVSTFGYGMIPVRLKIKPGVKYILTLDSKFKEANQCKAYFKFGILTEASASNTIVVRIMDAYDFSLMEYNICSSDVIESWSYGTRQNYDEITLDAEKLLAGDFDTFPYSKRNGIGDFIDSPVDKESFNTHYERSTFDERTSNLWWIAKQGLGHIYYSPGTPHDASKHFATAHPVYFNPRSH